MTKTTQAKTETTSTRTGPKAAGFVNPGLMLAACALLLAAGCSSP
jgi:hypothetical protein